VWFLAVVVGWQGGGEPVGVLAPGAPMPLVSSMLLTVWSFLR